MAVTIWSGDYDKSGRTDDDLGANYGRQWRRWNGIDQIAELIEGLKENTNSIRHIVSDWHVGEVEQMTQPTCLIAYN